MITTYPSTSPELHRKLRLWPAMRLIDLYKDYQCRYDAQPVLPAGRWHNPFLEKAELMYWFARDRDHDVVRRHQALAGLSAIMCPHPDHLMSDYTYGGRQYELDVPALLLTGNLTLPYNRQAQGASGRTYEDILTEQQLKKAFPAYEAFVEITPSRPQPRQVHAAALSARPGLGNNRREG